MAEGNRMKSEHLWSRKISSTSEEVATAIEENAMMMRHSLVVGYGIPMYKSFLDRPETYEAAMGRPMDEETKKNVQNYLDVAREAFGTRMRVALADTDGGTRYDAHEFIRIGMKNDVVKEKVQQFVNEADTTVFPTDYAYRIREGYGRTIDVFPVGVVEDLLEKNILPLDSMALIIEENMRRCDSLGEEFETKYRERFEARFLERCPEILARYGIDALAHDIRRMVRGVRVVVADPLAMRMERELLGAANVDANIIGLAPELVEADFTKKSNLEMLEHVYFHEMWHILSGRLNLKGESRLELSDRTKVAISTISTMRMGLRFGAVSEVSMASGMSMKERFRWLNEAVTERLTSELRGQEKDSYQSEREVVRFLCENGKKKIDFELFVKAYFENYEPKKSPEEKTIPHWRALREALNESWGPKFLVELDNRITQDGIKKAAIEMFGMKMGSIPSKKE